MRKFNVLAICPPDHYVLRNLEPLKDAADVFASNDPAVLAQHAPEAEIILYSGFVGKAPALQCVWPHVRQLKWIHSLAAGVDKVLFPELIESPVILTNARGVFKRSLAEFVVAGMLYFYKHIRRLVENQRAHRWDDFLVDWLRG